VRGGCGGGGEGMLTLNCKSKHGSGALFRRTESIGNKTDEIGGKGYVGRGEVIMASVDVLECLRKLRFYTHEGISCTT
jgi:hypothetical protein